MDVAKFLDQPIRFNPRRPRAPLVLVSSSVSSSPYHESANPTPSLTSTSSSEFDATLTSEKCFLPTQNPTATAPRILSPLADGKDQIVDKPEHTLAKPDRRSKVSSQGRTRVTKDNKNLMKSACSACRRRKTKCDGKRPACSTCVLKERCCEFYTRVGVSSQETNRERLGSYATILQLVRDADPVDCDRILQEFRAPQTLNAAIETVQRNWILKSGN